VNLVVRRGHKPFWQVRSNLISCPHHHRTEDAAKKCLPDVIEKYKELRWPKKKKA
jgi:hypothetical protein